MSEHTALRRLRVRSSNRFAELDNTSERLWSEGGMDMGLCQYHPAIDGRDGCRLRGEGGADRTAWTPAGVTETIQRLERSFEFRAELPSSIEQRARGQWVGADFATMRPCLLCGYLYTIETPPLYQEMNGLLADTRFWKEKGWGEAAGGRYSEDDLDFSTLTEGERALLAFARHLIFSLFVLHGKGVLAVHPGHGLLRGLNFSLDGQQEMRSRWTTFVSTTTSQRVAEQFGTVHHLVPKLQNPSIAPYIFHISAISEFPEEAEVLILPGVAAGRRYWFANQFNMWRLIREQARKQLSQAEAAPQVKVTEAKKCSIM